MNVSGDEISWRGLNFGCPGEGLNSIEGWDIMGDGEGPGEASQVQQNPSLQTF